MANLNSFEIDRLHQESMATVEAQLRNIDNPQLKSLMFNMAAMRDGKVGGKDLNPAFAQFEQGEMAQANAIAKALRSDWHAYNRKPMPEAHEVMKAADYERAVMKSTLDVGYLTDLAALTGGQSLGLISFDTKVMRGTVRPGSFTLYNVLKKTRANQMVDFWNVAWSVGGNAPGSAYTATSNQTNGAIAPNNGTYSNQYCTLKMLVDGRALTVALAAQSSYIDIAEQESANAAINLLASMNWALYWGNPNIYAVQPSGIASQIPAQNVFDFQAAYASEGGSLSQQQFLYNFIYQCAGFINGRQYGTTTHAFCTPEVIADIQSLVTFNLTQFLNTPQAATNGIVVNGDFQGMRTRFGDIQFPTDMFIDFRDRPLASIVNQLTGVATLNTAINAPTSVTGVAATGTGGFGTAYAGSYTYAVAAADSTMFETALTYSSTLTVAAGGNITLTITPNGSSAAAFRIFRSGLGYTAATNPASYRLVGEVAATGSSTVTFVDTNAHVPGSQAIFLLDLNDEHDAIDYRWLLPITKVDLFAQNMYMPWAITHIGTPRVKMPKWHALIKNYVPQTPEWNPLAPNASAFNRYAT